MDQFIVVKADKWPPSVKVNLSLTPLGAERLQITLVVININRACPRSLAVDSTLGWLLNPFDFAKDVANGLSDFGARWKR
jgi:hypothetical protein